MAENNTPSWMAPYVEPIKSLGFPVVVACALMWLGSKEIDKASARFDRLTEFIMTTLTQQSQKSTAALENNTAVLEMLRNDRQQERAAHHAANPPIATLDGEDGT